MQVGQQRHRDRWRWGIALVLSWLLMGWGLNRPAIAQIVPPSSVSAAANLNLTIDRTNTNIYLGIPQPDPDTDSGQSGNWKEVPSWAKPVVAALGCPIAAANDLSHSYYVDDALVVWAACPSSTAARQHGLQRQHQFDLTPLMAELAARHIPTLELTLSLPEGHFWGAEPALTPVLDGRVFEDELSVTDPSTRTISVWLGYRWLTVAGVVVPFGFVALIPIVATWISRHQILTQPVFDPVAAGYRHQRITGLAVVGVWIVWGAWAVDSGLFDIVDFVIGYNVTLLKTVIHFLLLTACPLGVTLVCAWLSYPVLVRLTDRDLSRSDHMQAVFWGASSLMVVYGFWIGIMAVSSGNWQLAGGWMAGSWLVGLVVAQMRIKSNDMTSHALTVGDLRDRVFALAQAAQVELKQIFVLPVRKSQMANAFAIQGGQVMLTDYLLQKLNKREVDAVIAHELAHLQHNHHGSLSNVLTVGVGAVIAGALVLDNMWPHVPWFVAGVLVAQLVYLAYSRRYEFQADAGGASLVVDPEAMISALAKITRLGRLPSQWSWVDNLIQTHPSFLRRAQHIAKSQYMTNEALDRLLERLDDSCETESDEFYALPQGFTEADEPIFSSPYKRRLTISILMVAIAVTVLPPAGLAWAAQLQHGVVWQTSGYWLGAISTVGLSLMVDNYLGLWGLPSLRRRLARKLQQADCDLDVFQHGYFVGFGPDYHLRNYEGQTVWDVGFVYLDREHLTYIGERTRFSLRRSDIDRLELSRHTHSWAAPPIVQVQWHTSAGMPQYSYFERLDGFSSLQLKRASKAMVEQWQQWHTDSGFKTTTPRGLPVYEQPQLGAVTSESIAQGHNLGAIGNYVVKFVFPAAIAVSLLFGLSILNGVYVVVVAGGVAVLRFVPTMFYRDRLPPDAVV